MKKLLRLFTKGVQTIDSKPISVKTTQREVPYEFKTLGEMAEDTRIPIRMEKHYASKEDYDVDHKPGSVFLERQAQLTLISELQGETNDIVQKLLEGAYNLMSSPSDPQKIEDWKKEYLNFLFSRTIRSEHY